jgi:hypothetical protein
MLSAARCLSRRCDRSPGGTAGGGSLFLFAIDSLGDGMDMAGLLTLVRGVSFDTSTLSGALAGLRIRVRVCPLQELESVGFMER